MKAGVCVSTVSIVGDRDGHRLRGWAPVSQISSTLVLTDDTSRCRRRLSRPGSESVVADAADGADDIFESRANVDRPAAGATLTAIRNVDAQRPQERLRPAQSAGECAGVLGPAVPGDAFTAATGAGTQEIGGATCP